MRYNTLETINSAGIFLLFFLIFPASVFSLPGDLDFSFGTNGKLIYSVSPINEEPSAVARQRDGKILVGGKIYNGTDYEFALVRYNPDGSLDPSFGGDGVVTTNMGSTGENINGIVVLRDGKIVVAGQVSGAGMAVARYNPDGSLDTTFDDDGKVFVVFNGGSGNASGIKLQRDGKFIVFGSISGVSGGNFGVGRLNPDGSPDLSFGTNGRAPVPGTVSTATAYDADIQSDGKIVVGTAVFSGGVTKLAAVRYNPNGTLDTGFDGDGVVVIPVSSSYESVNAVAIQPDQKIILGGYGTDSSSDSVLVRCNPDGSLDPTFGNGGKVLMNFSNFGSVDFITDVKIQQNGKIVAIGMSRNIQTLEDFNVARFNTNGTLDSSFGVGGVVKTDLGSPVGIHDYGYAGLIQPDGKILVVGASTEYQVRTNFSIARYQGDPTTPVVESPSVFDFDFDGKTDIGIFRPSDGSWWYSRSSDNSFRVYSFGTSTDIITPGDFTGDGRTDLAVFRPASGEWFIQRSEDSSFFSFPFGQSGDVPAPADYDGDGKTDAAVFRPSSGTWFIQNSGGSGTSVVNFGTADDKAVPADFDGDGKADIAIFRPSDGSWWYLQSTNAQFKVYRFGVGTDKPVQGDYTGDGKADLAIFRPSTGEWYFQRSEDNSYYSVPFGAAGDLAVPGDYDGDGRLDTAIFRPSTSNWFVNRSTDGILIANFGAAGDRPIPNAFVP